jgi:ornithine cyclodeaminase/alanine dehydrogenase-like protein (mu-crystallin family)
MKSHALFLSNDDIQQLLPPRVAVEVMEDVYREMALGTAVARTRTQTHIPTSDPEYICRFKTMDGASSKYGAIALRVLPDLVSWPRVAGKRVQVRKPAQAGRFLAFDLIFSADSGDLLAIIQDGYLQRLRIAGTHGAAVKLLARSSSTVLAILGSGWLAGGILEGIHLGTDLGLKQIRVYSPTVGHRVQFSQLMTKVLKVEVLPVNDPREAYQEADILVTCTNSTEPIFNGINLRRGMHLSSVSALEIDDACFSVADVTVVSMKEGRANEGINFAPSAIRDQIGMEMFSRKIPWDRFAELGEVITAKAPKRTTDEQVTFFCNNIGFGAQFAALGGKAYQLACEKGMGKPVDVNDWYQTVR